ncbi:cytochrome c/c1 heme lyase-domain-containing protein [Pelagophyceae sp. CCMP2097]|nr:cytochrome c/c1 heme lyase-domain-containing protein [Pelagophyceae sp. CCMP2097]
MQRCAGLVACASGSAIMTRCADASGCPMHEKPKAAGGCPMHAAGEVNPLNQMPATALQAQAPGQQSQLSTTRVASHIPKAQDDGATWEYPSPQMFWNALVRKGRANGASEEDMDTVVAVHNNMNELSWRAVLEWEAMHGDAKAAKLAKFVGRPTELSPKARLKMAFGHPRPFDRHDWTVRRPDGAEVRYIIDYYSDESKTAQDVTPQLSDLDAVKSIMVDVRPALDTLDACVDRLARMPARRASKEASPEVPFFCTADMAAASAAARAADAAAAAAAAAAAPTAAEAAAEAAAKRAARFAAMNAQIGAACAGRFSMLRDCGEDERKCAEASIALQHCVGAIVCPKEAAAFKHAAEHDADTADAAFATMDAAIARFATAARPQ